jgi:outer membrane receptor protein involved in Fe transport
MTRDSKIARAVHFALWTSASIIAATSFPAYAQDQDQDESAATVVVTGSRIQKPELESTTPILAISDKDLRGQGLTNVAEVAAGLPQFSAAFGGSRTQSTFSGAQFSGINTFNLRNLASFRTLTLVNGRRVPGGRPVSTGVDFNTIPTANISRFEVLTGGASAIYGADAVAGVVNLITRKDFTGIEFGANYLTTSESDNNSPGGYVMLGNAWEGGHTLLTVEYQKEGEVSCADRYLCAEDFLWNDATLPPVRGAGAYSAVAPIAKFQAGTTGAFYTTRNGNYNYTDANGALITFAPAIDGYNRNADRTLAIPTKRVMVAGEGEVSLPLSMTGFAEFNYGESRTVAPFEGNPFNSAGFGNFYGGGLGLVPIQASVPITNPFIPTALKNKALANGVNPTTGVLNWQQRFNSIASDRGATNTRKMYRAVAGVRGDFDSIGGFGSAWQWEISHVYGSTSLDSLSDGLVGTDRLYFGLRSEADPASPGNFRCIDAGARATGCVAIDPFHPYTQAMKDYLTVRAGQTGRNDLEDTTAYISGTLFDLPAGGLKGVFGVERRSFAGFLDYDEVINRALVTGNQIGDVSRIKTVTEDWFTEFNVPVLEDKPFARSLELNGSYRSSNPDRGDDYDTWGYGLNWQPIAGLRIRASKARAVRTPVPEDLSGNSQTFGVVVDPCSAVNIGTGSASRAANCAAAGINQPYSPPQSIQQSVAGVVLSNPDLIPETGDTLTFGFVWQPGFLQGFNFSVDRFQIDIDDAINTVGRQLEANLCYDQGLFCDNVIRGPSVNQDASIPALIAVNDRLINAASIRVRGYDVEAGYRLKLGGGDFGALDLRAIATIYDKAQVTPLAGQTTVDYLGFAGGSTSDQGWVKRQFVTTVGYAFREFGASLHSRYIAPSYMAPGFTQFGKVGSHIYHDVRFNFDFKEGSEVYLGVNNVLDKAPPFFASGTSGTQALDTIPAYYDVFGRTYFGGIRVKF